MPETKAHQIYKLADGSRVPSVTTVINDSLGWNKQTLIAWTRKMALAGEDPDKVRDEAADVGTLAHAMIHDYLSGEKTVDMSRWTPEQVQRASQGYAAFVDWQHQVNFTLIASELQCVSETYRYGGTIDIVAWINLQLTICDVKTSAGVYPEHLVQVAAYQQVYEEKLEPKGIKTKALIIQLDKNTGAFSAHPYPDLTNAREVFMLCLRLHELHRSVR